MKKHLLWVLLIMILACKKDVMEPKPQSPSTPVLKGDKGGDHSVAIFPKYNNKGIASRIWIKYTANKAPKDTAQYDEADFTMVEPGLTYHVHFTGLLNGTYFIHAVAQSNSSLKKDTVLVLTDSTKKSMDIDLLLE